MPMRMEINLSQRLELRMKLAPQILQSIEILQLPTLELLQRIKQELVENPVLEMEEPKEEASEEAEQPQAAAETAEREDALEEPPADAEQPSFERVEPIEDDWREYGSQFTARRSSDGEKDRKLEAMQNTAARPMSLQDYLFNQFSLLDLTGRQQRIGENIIYNIDNDGYLRSPLTEVFPPQDTDVTVEEAERVLGMVQTLDPPGVGARNLRECLLLQMDDGSDHPLAKTLIDQHLEDIEKNRFPKMARELGKPIEAIKQAVQFITHLNPRPGSLFGEEMPQYITPDVIVDQNDQGDYDVRLEDAQMPRLFISSLYTQMLGRDDTTDEEREYIRKKIQSARWLIDAIQQRRDTLLRISREIFKVQRDFLDRGIKQLHPLKMRTIAERTSVHVSTVSRAIAEKYAQTPRGIFPLKFFFTGGTRAAGGEMESRKSVKQRVLDVIENEDKHNPLSDGDIAGMLQRQGLDIARRTVTKYRKAMTIPTSRRRRAY